LAQRCQAGGQSRCQSQYFIRDSQRQDASLGTLFDAGALRRAPGQRIVYATDLAFSKGNVSRLCALARRGDQLFIEGGFLQEDQALAAGKKHLTALQAGEIARKAVVRDAHQIHLSPRYL
jgi:ribonuclease Z